LDINPLNFFHFVVALITFCHTAARTKVLKAKVVPSLLLWFTKQSIYNVRWQTTANFWTRGWYLNLIRPDLFCDLAHFSFHVTLNFTGTQYSEAIMEQLTAVLYGTICSYLIAI